MEPNKKYLNLSGVFWGHIRYISEQLGYSARGKDFLKEYNHTEVYALMKEKGVEVKKLDWDFQDAGRLIDVIVDYLNFRSNTLLENVKPSLMRRSEAKIIFEQMKKKFNPTCKLPMNKQKGDKKHYAYLTCIVNMIVENVVGNQGFDSDPHSLVIFTRDSSIVRTLSRRYDGVYPSTVNPKSIWEIKEYYGTTTFGSRVADGIYETALDGQELLEMKDREGIRIKHYLIIDDYDTWWGKGKSYLCRIIDMLHMGYLDEAIFGREIVERLPVIVDSWLNLPS